MEPKHCWTSDGQGQPKGTLCGAVVKDMETQVGTHPLCAACEAVVAERAQKHARAGAIRTLTSKPDEVLRIVFSTAFVASAKPTAADRAEDALALAREAAAALQALLERKA